MHFFPFESNQKHKSYKEIKQQLTPKTGNKSAEIEQFNSVGQIPIFFFLFYSEDLAI